MNAIKTISNISVKIIYIYCGIIFFSIYDKYSEGNPLLPAGPLCVIWNCYNKLSKPWAVHTSYINFYRKNSIKICLNAIKTISNISVKIIYIYCDIIFLQINASVQPFWTDNNCIEKCHSAGDWSSKNWLNKFFNSLQVL